MKLREISPEDNGDCVCADYGYGSYSQALDNGYIVNVAYPDMFYDHQSEYVYVLDLDNELFIANECTSYSRKHDNKLLSVLH